MALTDTRHIRPLAVSQELWTQVRSYRFQNRFTTEAEAIRSLVEAGLRALNRQQGGVDHADHQDTSL